MTRMVHIQLLFGMMANLLSFCIGTSLFLKTFAYGNLVSRRDVGGIIKWIAFGCSHSSTSVLMLSILTEWTQSKSMILCILKEGSLIFFFNWKIMFFVSPDTINALKKYLKLCKGKVLCWIHGQSVAITEKERATTYLWQYDECALSDETVIDVLTDLTNCLVMNLWSCLIFSCRKPRQRCLTLIFLKAAQMNNLR